MDTFHIVNRQIQKRRWQVDTAYKPWHQKTEHRFQENMLYIQNGLSVRIVQRGKADKVRLNLVCERCLQRKLYTRSFLLIMQ
jgi:hypothetical protein